MMTIDEYKKAEKELEEIRLEDDTLREKQNAESSKLHTEYRVLERELEDKKSIEQNKLTKKHESETEKITKKSGPPAKIIGQHTRIMNIMDIHKEQDSTDFTVYKFDYPRDSKGEEIRTQDGDYPDKQQIPYTAIYTIKKDKYAKIQAFIVENDKPKNKFSLLMAGKTIFTEKIMNLLDGYVNPCCTEGTNIVILIKDLPTENELHEYYNRNKSKILKKEFFEQFPQIEKEYETVLKNTDNKDWELAYWESQKHYYEEHYSRGTETKEYQEVLKQIKKIKASMNQNS